jgi:hypothetical protein
MNTQKARDIIEESLRQSDNLSEKFHMFAREIWRIRSLFFNVDGEKFAPDEVIHSLYRLALDMSRIDEHRDIDGLCRAFAILECVEYVEPHPMDPLTAEIASCP